MKGPQILAEVSDRESMLVFNVGYLWDEYVSAVSLQGAPSCTSRPVGQVRGVRIQAEVPVV